MASQVYSDNPLNIEALAERLASATSLDRRQADNVALQLLGRKELKIKSGALAQILLGANKDAEPKALRAELIDTGFLEKIEGSGVSGKPAVYRILADVEPLAEEADETASDDAFEPIEVEAQIIESYTAESAEPDEDDDTEEPQPVRDVRNFVSQVGRGAHFARKEGKPAPERKDEKKDDSPKPEPKHAAKAVVEEPVKEPTTKQPAPKKQVEKPAAGEAGKKKPEPVKPAGEKPVDEKAAAEKKKPKRKHRKRAERQDSPKTQDADVKPQTTEAAKQQNDAKRRVSMTALARAVGQRIAKAVPTTKEIVKVPTANIQVAKKKKGASAHTEQVSAAAYKHKLRHDADAIAAWVETSLTAETPVASRRQRAYEILGDEKAFEGKPGERLFKRLNEKGINPTILKIQPQRPAHFTGFYAIGSNKPFIVVENLDTYDEICRLLRGKKSVRLFGAKVGGVIFGGGCKASVSHALDDYLSDIGYAFDFVYYAGDIDREGARIIEQTRNANVIGVRMHVGMYKAMLAAHKKRVKDGFKPEAAATLQGIPQNLAGTIKDLPVVTRMQFKNVLSENIRIPQEILTTSMYRDSSSDALERALNK